AARADPAAEGGIVEVAVRGPIRIEAAGCHLLGNECADLPPQRLAFRRQADRIEAEIGAHGIVFQRAAGRGQNSSAPRAATRLPSAAAHWLSLPKSSRQDSSRRVNRCSTCSRVNPMAP